MTHASDPRRIFFAADADDTCTSDNVSQEQRVQANNGLMCRTKAVRVPSPLCREFLEDTNVERRFRTGARSAESGDC